MKLFLKFAFLLLLCSSCSTKNRLYVVLDDGFGVDVGDPVELNNLKIGTIEEIHFTKYYKVCLTIGIVDETLRIPADSKFYFLINALEIEAGKSNRFLKQSDTVYAVPQTNFQINKILDEVSEFRDNSIQVREQDTIVRELNELNEEMQKLKEKINPEGK
ncbi:MlaD family protein [Fluviicola sp.]|uniref:MlaD family protein n=1 Tax=Fluviicola sp. TaxID=1917219 RepID=UPI00260625E1|nr:MlaD family protein [Fluviicola sp.]